MEGLMFSSFTQFSSNVPFVLEAIRYPVKDPIFQTEIEANESKYMSFDSFDVEFNPERSTIICAYPKEEYKEEAKTYMMVPEIRECAKIIFTYKDGLVTVEKYLGNVLARTRSFPIFKAFENSLASTMEGHIFSSITQFISNVPFVLEASRYPMKDPIFQTEIEANKSKCMSFNAFDVEFNPERSTIICAYPKGESKEEAKTYMIVPEIRECAKIIFTYKDGKVTVEKYFGNVFARTRAFLELKGKWEKVKDFVANKGSFKARA